MTEQQQIGGQLRIMWASGGSISPSNSRSTMAFFRWPDGLAEHSTQMGAFSSKFAAICSRSPSKIV